MDGLKVDRAFIAQLCNGPEDETFFLAMLSMPHALGMSVVADGVEPWNSCASCKGCRVTKSRAI
jgi:EAL domain-containing protein (putative c-di-GMP-specific phosphodiesterase class I)